MIAICLVLIWVSQVHSSYQIIVSYHLLSTNLFFYFDLYFTLILNSYTLWILSYSIFFIYYYKIVMLC